MSVLSCPFPAQAGFFIACYATGFIFVTSPLMHFSPDTRLIGFLLIIWSVALALFIVYSAETSTPHASLWQNITALATKLSTLQAEECRIIAISVAEIQQGHLNSMADAVGMTQCIEPFKYYSLVKSPLIFCLLMLLTGLAFITLKRPLS